MEKAFKIYKYTNLINGMSYIGQTSRSLKERADSNGYGYKQTTYFYSAIQKYGWDNFKSEILLTVGTKEMANKAEEAMIIGYNTLWPNGYNDSCGCKFSIRTKQKQAESRGKYYSAHPQTEESNKKRSEAQKGKPKPHSGSPKSEETKRKISESHKDKKRGHWYTNGTICTIAFECPEGFRLGRTI